MQNENSIHSKQKKNYPEKIRRMCPWRCRVKQTVVVVQYPWVACLHFAAYFCRCIGDRICMGCRCCIQKRRERRVFEFETNIRFQLRDFGTDTYNMAGVFDMVVMLSFCPAYRGFGKYSAEHENKLGSGTVWDLIRE